MSWDIVIVGAGPAGLFFGCKLLETYPSKKVLILEKYNYIGGRVVTYRKRLANREVQWEIGAGRIASDHLLVRKAMTKYGLHWAPLGTNGPPLWLESGALPQANPFTSLLPTKLAPLTTLPKRVLAESTIGSLLRKLEDDEWIRYFPYWSEIHTLRTDIALKGFLGGEFGGGQKFGVIAEGFQALPEAMAHEFVQRGGMIQEGIEVTDVHALGDGGAKILYTTDHHHGALFATTCVLALHADALQKLPSVRSRIPALRHLQMEPLVRMYAVFPVRDGRSWFTGLPSMATKGHVRYIIPINDKKGIIMISYTDGADARYWIDAQKRKGNDWVREAVLSEVRALLPGHSIPDPYAFKIHPWTSGCTYWQPGDYDPKEMINASLHVEDSIFACGESLSLRQAWVEGALESAEALWDLDALQKRLQK